MGLGGKESRSSFGDQSSTKGVGLQVEAVNRLFLLRHENLLNAEERMEDFLYFRIYLSA